MAQVSYGTITITDTNDISRIYMEYCRSTKNQLSGDTVPNITRAWDVKTPPWVDGEYIWQRAVVEKSGTLEKTYGTPVCISGEKGETGQQGPQGGTGAAGRSLDSTETKYAQVAANSTEAQVKALIESRWTLNVPSYNSSLPEYWVRVTNVYSNPTETQKIYYKDNGITDAVKTSAEANTTAGQAKTQAAAADGKAETAIGTANTANTNATNALDIATGINQHFWTISTDYATGVPAGSYITDTAIDTFKSNKTGGNLLTRSDGIWIRNGINTLTSLTGTALTFYNPTNNKAQLVIGANGTLQSGNYDRGENDTFSAFGTKIDLTQGEIYSPYFRLSQGNQGKAPGAYISGQIEALSGNIGGTEDGNYWDIGDFVNFNNVSIGSLIGHGNSMIQLGQSSVWRLSNNRIHSGWYLEDDKYLHFPSFSGTNEYYDYGIHVPESTSQSFIYLRTANTTNKLSSLLTHLNDDIGTTQTPWTYKFYVDGNGNVHAPGFYIGDSTTPIGGGAGTTAQKIINSDNTYGKGSSKKPIYIDTGGYVQESNSDVGNATTPIYMSGGTLTALGYTIAKSVPSDAVFTDKKVRSTQANTTKLWLMGKDTAGDHTGELNYDSNVYLTTTAGILHATKFEGDLTGTAAKATSDSDGNPINTTYLKLSGGNVTGAVSFGSSVSVDELTVGDLVVNGTASFTNNLQANTINGVAVGSNPKFTDTVTTVTVTGSGNAITGASASGGAVTLTKGTTFPTGSGTNGYLTKWTGTNTIGNGPALGSDTTKFLNNKGEWAVPAGTGLTSVGASGSGGITISGSPITTSGTIAIGLNLSTAINGLGEGASPATREDYIVAQYAGGGTTTTSYHRRKLSNIFAALNSSDITTALGYTPYNATNPNGYTSNTGTVTSIATSSPITGGTITGSGTIGHATSGVGNAVTTAGLYKFKYDTYGHITGVSAIAKADITGLGIPAQDTTYSNASTTTAGLMSAADKKKLDNIQVDSSGQAVAANVAGRWGIDVTFNDANVAQVGHSNSAITASNTQAAKTTSSVTSTQLAFGDVINFPYVAYDTYGHITSKTNLYFKMPAAPSSTGSATNDSDGNQINTTYIKKSIGTAAGDIIYWSAASTPVRLAKGSNGQVLKLANGVPIWGTDNNDNTWRGIQVDGTDILGTGTNTNKLNLKAGTNISLSNSSGSVTITATDVKVTQTNTTGNADYRLLFSENANDTTSTETARKSTYLKFNPSSGLLKTYGISSASGSTPVIYSDVSAAEIKAADSSLTTSSSDSDWLKALLIALCNKYPGKTGYIFKGTMSPNSVGWYEVHIYSTSTKDSTTGLPQYSFGRFLKYINNYSLFGTASYSYSYRTVDTNTWNPLTTSQAGYVSTAPNDTAKFLRGDATWAQVSSANLSDIRLTWSSSVSTTDWILAHDTAATGTPLFRAMSPANLKTTMSLNNVENKSSATIRGELTSSNVTTALGYTPVNKAGDTMAGPLKWNSSSLPQFSGAPSYLVGIDAFASGGTMKWQEVGQITVGSATKATQDKNGNDITTKYVTIDTNQTITASQKTFTGATRWGSASKYGAVHYDTSLEALVFSFA